MNKEVVTNFWYEYKNQDGGPQKENISVVTNKLHPGLLRRNVWKVEILAMDENQNILAKNKAKWHYDKNKKIRKVVSYRTDNYGVGLIGLFTQKKVQGIAAAMIAHTVYDLKIPEWYSSDVFSWQGEKMYSKTLKKYYSDLVEVSYVTNFLSGRYKLTPKN
ncbi:MAG TPA: hypothetical protein VF189_03695 [Patescibacteria group bacterium]